MTESALWNYLRERLRGHWVAQRHEEKFGADVPDVSYSARGTDGWLELKSFRAWPVRITSKLKTARGGCGLTAGQVAWLRERGSAGNGLCFVLVRVGSDHLLFHWRQARWLRHAPTRQQLTSVTLLRWDVWDDATRESLLRVLTGEWGPAQTRALEEFP